MFILLKDLQFGARMLLRRPSFTAVALVTLALGVGATSTVFSVMNAVILSPLPYRDPQGLAIVWAKWRDFDKTWLSDMEVMDLRREARSFQTLGAWTDGAVNVTGGSAEPERLRAGYVMADVFRALGTSPALGRTFADDEDQPGRDDVVVIGYGLWQRRFSGDPGVVGRTIELNGKAAQIVGVMPADFMLPLDFTDPEPTTLWLPLGLDMKELERGSHSYHAVARLQPGVTAAQAAAETRTITDRLIADGQYPKEMQFSIFAVALDDEVRGHVRPAILVLMAAVAFLLLIACVNVANLMLARADERHREIAVRISIGAGRMRLVRQLLTESLLLAVLGAAAGLVVAWISTRAVAAWPLATIPRLSDAAIDWRVISFTAVVAFATSLVFGMVPALHAGRLELTSALKDSTRGATSGVGRQRVRRILVVTQIAMAVLLLVCAALLIRSLRELQRIDPGFEPRGVLTLRVSLPGVSYPDATATVPFYDRLLERVRTLPGVEAAGLVRSLPLANQIGDWGLQIEGYSPPPGRNAKGDWQVASPGYFEAIGERLVRGRFFEARDTTDAPQVTLINETMARTYWPDQDPLGKRMRQGSPDSDRPWITVIGVVKDVRHNGINAVVKEKFYRPASQFHVTTGNVQRSLALVAKTNGDPLALVAPIRAELRALDPNLPVSAVRTMDDVVGTALAAPRFTGWLLGLFAALALTLAAVGAYGVLSYLVNQRTRELGIRMALGASPAHVRRLVVGQGLWLSVVGAAIGLALSLVAGRALGSQLYGVTPTDSVSFVLVPAILLAVALVASWLPARRAARVDPLECLRAE